MGSLMTSLNASPGPFDGLPDFKPLPDDMAPQMKAALLALRNALTEPPQLGDQWPFANSPRPQAALDARARGRPPKVAPNQVVRLARLVRLGDSISAAAKKAGLSRRAAQRILSGQCGIAHQPAVTAAGVELPLWQKSSGCADGVQKAQKPPRRPDQTRGATGVAKPLPEAL